MKTILLLAALLAALLGGLPAQAGDLYRYDAPDGSVGFTDAPQRIPPAARESARVVVPQGTRWTPSAPARSPYRWQGIRESYEARQAHEVWAGRAESVRRGLEDAATLEVLAGELQAGQSAAALNAEHARRRAERLEDSCRAADCLPGHLR